MCSLPGDSLLNMPQLDAAHDQGRKVAPSMRRNFAPCGHEKMSLLLSCEVAAPLCGDHEAECSEGQGADTPERRGCTEHRRPGMGRSQQAKGTLL